MGLGHECARAVPGTDIEFLLMSGDIVANLRIVQPDRRAEPNSRDTIVDAARAALVVQSRAIANLANRLDGDFQVAVDLISRCDGRLITCGIGKSGHIGKKLAATFSCSGRPSIFLHASEAAHGDLGAVRDNDVIMLISNSGETEEVVRLIPFLRELGVSIIALVGDRNSSIAKNSDCILDASVEGESCPLDIVPTTSTLAALAMGDAVAMSVMRRNGFSIDDFRRFHPGGALGRNRSGHVRDFMQRHPLPTCSPDCLVGEVLQKMTNGQLGLIVVINESLAPVGILTDGDLRRSLQRHENLLTLPVSAVMNTEPVTILETARSRDARERMHRMGLKALLVVDSDGKLTGVAENSGDQTFE